MSQLVLSAIPGFFDLADSAIAAGKPLTDDTMLKISHNAKFSAVRGKLIFMGFYANGNTVPTPIDPDDGYAYSRAECQFVWTIYSNRAPATGFVPGQATPPPISSSQPGQLYNFPGGWDINDVTGLVTLWTTYYNPGGAETINNDGIIKVYAICLRSSLTSRPGPPAPPAPVAPTSTQPAPVTYTPTPPAFSPPVGAQFFLPDTYLDSGQYPTINPTIGLSGGYLCAQVCGLNYPPYLWNADCTWYGFSNPSGSKSGVSLTVYSRQVASTITPGLGTVRYSLDGGTTWTNIRSSTDLWDASTTPDVIVLPDSQDFSLVRVEVSQAVPTQPLATGVNVYLIFITASLSP
jgi:hypothetical protein